MMSDLKQTGKTNLGDPVESGVNMIHIEQLYKSYRGFPALRGISLQVKKGEIYGFIGQNGAGKTTTMNILAGLSRPDAGLCLVNGRDIRRIRHPGDLHLGYLPEEPHFYPWLSARETLENLIGPIQRVDELLHWVGLSPAASRRVGGFSRGMRQRLGLAAALVHNPELLILDEPSSALDPEGRSDVLRLIRELRQMGKTILFSTHILSDVERVCDTVGIIASGEMILQQPMATISQKYIKPVFDIELIAPCPPDVCRQLQAGVPVLALEQHHNRLTATVNDAQDGSIWLMSQLAEARVAILSITRRGHNLEDIFIEEVNGHEKSPA
ncbi:MAG: ABC transporter ATP-binding protein [Ruminococcaceae bacterium]|jgi:ABC-2 type transport system ATP-binding protein|nr:ABC transporter ATP-binding protein [Oscillospiraceae bacterium]